MHTDSLLDFLHIYASPALLFNLQGELLFSNRPAELCNGGEIATEVQVQSAIFDEYLKKGHPSSSASSPTSGSSNTGTTLPQQLRLPAEIQSTVYTKTSQAEDFNFRFSMPAPAPSSFSASSSASASGDTARPSSSRPSSSSSTARPSSSSGLSNRPRGAKRRSRPSSRSGPPLPPLPPAGAGAPSSSSSVNGHVSSADDGTSSSEASSKGSNNDDSDAWFDEDYPTPTGYTVERRQLHWTVTTTKCKRIVAIATDKATSTAAAGLGGTLSGGAHGTFAAAHPARPGSASSSSRPMTAVRSALPTLCNRDIQEVSEITPVIRTPWQSQPRFEPIKKGGGEMGEKIRAFDWDNHPLGGINSWPQARVEMVGLILRSPVPMTAYLEYPAYVIYNDAYIAVLGQTKHRAGVLGKPAIDVWGEIWQYIEIPLQDAMNGIPIERHAQPLFFERLQDGGPNNKHEEVHATWYYIPYWGPDRVIGNLHMLFENQQTISDRRFSTINELSANLLTSRSTIDLCRNALEVLSHLDKDLPYCLAYTTVDYHPPELLASPDSVFEGGGSSLGKDRHISISSSASSYSTNDMENASNIYIFALQETVGCAFDSALAPSRIVVDTDEDASTPLAMPGPDNLATHTLPTTAAWQSAMVEMVRTGNIVQVTNVQDWLIDVPHRGHEGMLPYRGVVIPLKQGEKIVACIAFALNPALPWSQDFKTFIDILSRQMNLSLTMVKTYETEVQRAEELAALDRAKTSFFTSISHELRTPLTLILGPVKDLTQDTTLTRAQASSISLVYRNARRLLRLVNSILDFARAEAGKLSSQFSPMALGVITTELASSFRSALESAGIEFVVENLTNEDLLVWVDQDKWDKIVFNLLSNAFKFTTKGRVRVTSSSDQYYFYLEVQDSGVGIPANELSSIFERFVRVENNQARSIEGSGIGLSLTLELVKAHGGKIAVESVLHKGTTFKLKIPLGNEHLPRQYLINPNAPSAVSRQIHGSDDYQLHAADSGFGGVGAKSESNTDDSPENASKASSDLWPPLLFGERQTARILLADDNSDLRTFIKSILGKYADVQEAVDGEAAWELLQENPYDLVLSDIMMPRMTGFQLLAAIRGSDRLRAMPVILLSARAGEDAGIESLSSGADDHLSKPFSSKELILRVHSHLQLAAIRTELESRVAERTAALEESKETFKRLSELLQVGVHRSDREGRIIWANRKWMSVLGLEDGEWDGWEHRIHPDDREAAKVAYIATVESGEGYGNPIEMRLMAPDGSVTDITYELQAERGSLGECIGFVGVFSDVSSLRKLERDRMALERQRREEAEQNRQLQEHFIDVTCHELRNPLNAISNSAELLGESLNKFFSRYAELKKDPTLCEAIAPLEADMKDDLEAVETILLSSRHQKRIADDVLHISKISGNLVQLVQNEWRPVDALQNVLKMFSLEIASKQIDSSLVVHPSFSQLGDVVIGDETRYVQVCVNLLANAIKFLDTSPVKRLQLAMGGTPILPEATLKSLYKSDKMHMEDLLPLCGPYSDAWQENLNDTEALLHFSISDTGPGMSKEEQSRIFMRFSQASPKTFGEFGGFGLGLWISKRLVELHGGAVALQSIEGVGTVFRLYIKVQRVPKSLAPPVSVAMNKAASEISRTVSEQALTKTVKGRNPLILVVEDNDVNLKVLARLLKTLKCDVVTACDGSECLTKIDNLVKDTPYPPVDLIFMDLEMPIMDGLTATKRIREAETEGLYTGAAVPIVAVSANARQIYADLSTEAGMNGFLRKPYSKAQLSEVLDKFIIRENA